MCLPPYDLAIPFLGTYPADMHTDVYRETCTKTFTAEYVMAKKQRNPKVHQHQNG